ncbi:MAG: type IV pilus twitching motility protein PilT [Candidatus Marinimicrobia bacterium]|nr:type IV pilus twitching motility protein PilT [Candidatus Neomarinimicrobiota bacterium]
MEIFELLEFMKEKGASDLHLSPHSQPIVRVDGQIKRCNLKAMTPEDVHILIYGIMTDQQRKLYEKELEIDFSCEFKGIGRFRVNVFKGYFGDTAVLRSISNKCYSFEELGLPEILKNLVLKDKGLILVTGPTGSGKSTTMNTMIDYINEHQSKHIITIEDPIEFIHTSKKSLINHREVGLNTHSFSKALRSALREDPDVIVVGEMRDLETTSLAITAAETGHLVFGTLHTSGATKTVDRIIDQFPPQQQSQIRMMVSESILGIVSQVLLPRKGGGRIAAFEVLIRTSAVSNLIREKKTYQLKSVLQTSSDIGMNTLDQSLLKLVKKGLVVKAAVDDMLQEFQLGTMS